MNDQFLKDALQIVDNLTPQQIADGLKEHGVLLVSVYSGKPLAEAPFDHLWEEMPVISERYGEGKIIEKITVDERGRPIQGLKIRWNKLTPEGVVEVTDCGLHAIFTMVKVK